MRRFTARRAACSALALTLGLLLFTGCQEGWQEDLAAVFGGGKTHAADSGLAEKPAADDNQGKPVSANKVPVAALLHREKELRDSRTLVSELVQEKSQDNMDIWAGKIAETFQALADHEVLPAELWQKIQFYSGRDTVNFTVVADNAGFENITCNFGLGSRPPYYIQCDVAVNEKLPAAISASLPFEYRLDEETRDALVEHFIAHLGMDAYGDWEKQAYEKEEDDLPSMDYSGYLSLYHSPAAGLYAYMDWYADEEKEYVMFTLAVTTETVL